MRRRGWAVGVASALALAGAIAGAAHGQPGFVYLGVDARIETGYVALIAIGTPGASVSFVERTDDGVRRLATGVIGASGRATVDHAARWRCDRLTRRFSAVVRDPDGAVGTTNHDIRTPSCRDRVAVSAPPRVPKGRQVKVELRDRWRLGDLRGRMCVHGPRRRPRCSSLAIGARAAGLVRRFGAPTAGRWRVDVRTQAGLVKRVVEVGTPMQRRAGGDARPLILAAGDSLMQGIDSFLADRLEPRARVRSAARPGTGLSKLNLLDWTRFARAQAARYRPDVTVMVIGGGDGLAMRTRAGILVACCERAWIEEYARRARAIMVTFGRGGAGEVIWLDLPAPRSELFQPVFRAVNTAITRAAQGLPAVRILSLSKVLTPGFRYRPRMIYRGRSVRVREVDGVHLSPEGARIATSLVIRQLERRGAL